MLIVLDTDDDNDGSIDPNDVSQWNPQICQDFDSDTCDDCSQNPTSSSSPTTPPWPAYTPSMGNDGPDSDSDGLCDLGDPTPEGYSPLVINEIDYDQPGLDDAEFIELKNITDHSINLSLYRLLLINGSVFPPSAYQTIDLPDINLAASDYFVVCGTSASVPNCDLNILTLIQNGSPDAVTLYSESVLIDTVSYEGDTSGYTEGMGIIVPGDDGIAFDSGLSRYPDGQDTNNNTIDFILSCSTPGQINTNNPSCLAP